MTTPEVRAEALAYMRRERPCEDDSMARYRAEYLYKARRLSGGRASHAFFGDEELPACGLWFGRGPEDRRRDPVWHPVESGFLFRARFPLHRACALAVSRRRRAYDVREWELSRVSS